MARKAVIRKSGEGLKNSAFDLPRVFKVLPDDCDGALAVWEETVPEGVGPPLHIHHNQYEFFAVLQGCLRFQCGDETSELESGGTILIPPDTPHTFKGLAPEGSRCLLTLTPGTGARFFLEVEEERLNPAEHMERIVEIGMSCGMEFVGPPLD